MSDSTNPTLMTPTPFRSKRGYPLDFPDVLEGPRIALLKLTHSYAESIQEEFTQEIVKYMSPSVPKSIEETLEFIARADTEREEGTSLHFAITHLASKEFLGVCGLHGTQNPSDPELGLWLKKSAHGNRYGREAIVVLKNWAEAHLDIQSFVYPVDRHNIASRKIPESLAGIVFEEKVVASMDGTRQLDEVVYRIPISER